ncbi:hypothetical protein E4H12_07900 [Candidatus Thorarchaeota archaeon]|nr:MAG: hypothetical protein E4H12_07900 [Candidatus Thorarchaeota archaeon]
MESPPLRDSGICPDCHNLLEDGYVVGPTVLWWTNKEPNIQITKDREYIEIARNLFGWEWARVRGKRCPKCNLMIIRHSE